MAKMCKYDKLFPYCNGFDGRKCPPNVGDGCEIVVKKPKSRVENGGQFKKKTNQYNFENDYIVIHLSSGDVVKIDPNFYTLCKRFYWALRTSDSGNKYAYARDSDNNYKLVLMHRLIMQPSDDLIVDHINGDGLDNRTSNLRVCSKADNSHNMRPYKGYKGVSKIRGKWQAKITKNYCQIYLGLYDSPHEAADVYNKAAILNFGEFARTNIIDEKYLRGNK